MQQEQAKLGKTVADTGKTQADAKLAQAKATETMAKAGGHALDNEAGERVLAAQPFTGLVPPGTNGTDAHGPRPGVDQEFKRWLAGC
jgi:hypothetical protein